LIRFENVSFSYGTGPDILKDISFTLAPGSYHFLSGPSGSGKTSLMSLLYLGHRPKSGKITMLSQDTSDMNRDDFFALRQKIGVVFQNFRLLNHLTAFDNVALPLRILNRPEKEIKSNVSELLDWVGLGDAQGSLPPTLSGGQQQRVAIARAVITRPKLLLADEPTGNLDNEIGYRLMRLFEQLNKMGTTTVIATHNQDIMEKYKHPKLSLDQGTIHINGKKDLLIRTIRDVY
tara:strand:- start:76 stop:774 length:699 start_codon:yes stop_codon:yes gene_type:complete